MYWERSLPFALEAFFFSAESPEGIAAMRQTHANFLEWYGLTAAEVRPRRMHRVCTCSGGTG